MEEQSYYLQHLEMAKNLDSIEQELKELKVEIVEFESCKSNY